MPQGRRIKPLAASQAAGSVFEIPSQSCARPELLVWTMTTEPQNEWVYKTMADSVKHTQPPREKPREGGVLRWLFVALVLGAIIGGAVLWRNYRDGAAPSASSMQAAAESARQGSDQSAQQFNALQQTLKDLQLAQQRLQDQLAVVQGKTADIEELKRQVSAAQGESKLLSDQLGALSARVDSLLSTSAAAPPSPATKKKRGAR